MEFLDKKDEYAKKPYRLFENERRSDMKCPVMIKMGINKNAWLPPKRVWGELSDKAWKTLKKLKP